MDNPYLIALLLTVAVGLFLYILLVPRNSRVYTQGDYQDSDNKALKGAAVLGNELYAMLPASFVKNKKRDADTRTHKLFQMSANPWNIKPADFTFFKVVFMVVGLILGGLVGWGLSFVGLTIPFWLIAVGAGLYGFSYPGSVYKKAADARDLEFKRQLPEALDLMEISLAGGGVFQEALRETVPNMQPGVLRDEFKQMLKTVDAGATMDTALNQFANRAPNDSIVTFIRAIQEAIELDVPLIEALRARSEASRREFFQLIQEKTATLSSKMMAILVPTVVPALLICVLAPSAFSLMESL